MTTHRLTASQTIDRPIDEVFAFFSRPENLGRITPPAMGFEQRSGDLDMRVGLDIEHLIRPFPGFSTAWRSRITAYDPPRSFADVQLRGPYRRWEHHHTFQAVGSSTRIDDEVQYELPLGVLGDALAGGLVAAELREIFRYRARAIEAIFAKDGTREEPLTVAVAGGTGFVGGAIAAELRHRGHRVVVLSHRGEAARGWLPDDVELRRADVATGDGLAGALAGVDALVIALAFRNSPIEAPRRGQTFMAVDAAGTERLVRASGEAGVGRLLYVSGAGAAPDARRHWFRAKWRAEAAVRGSAAAWTILRPTWIYGPRDVSLNRFVGFARRLPVVPLTNLGRQPMAPVFIDDVAGIAADALESDAAVGRTFEVAGPDVLPMRTVVGRAIAAAGLAKPVVPGPTPLLKLGLQPLRLLPQPPLTPDAIDFINQPATADPGPLLAILPRRLTPFDEGIASYLPPETGPGRMAIDAAPAARASIAPRRAS